MVQPFPFGAREGELVVRVTDVLGGNPIDDAAELAASYRSHALYELWLDAADVAGGGEAHKLGLELRRTWREIIVTAPAGATAWPFFPTRIYIDMSEHLCKPAPSIDVWLEEMSVRLGKNPGPTEIYAIAPAPEMLTWDVLHALDTFASPEDGCTLYVAEDHMARAVQASLKTPRPWTVRRLGALPPALQTPGATC